MGEGAVLIKGAVILLTSPPTASCLTSLQKLRGRYNVLSGCSQNDVMLSAHLGNPFSTAIDTSPDGVDGHLDYPPPFFLPFPFLVVRRHLRMTTQTLQSMSKIFTCLQLALQN